ncbi:hypothetical protein ES695_02825 [Candidatus Atribacteria bacterium 1244-E10-H5-B2]|nr:MAG: hypothetical protein ES695_02825 [Candidatus Atribacteria bacterium 1244-E10-H5-B2]
MLSLNKKQFLISPRLRVGKYKGIERIDIRLWVEGTKGLGPTRQGINFDMEWRDRFLEMIGKIEDIEDI